MRPAFRDSDKKTAQLGLFGEDAHSQDAAEGRREESASSSPVDVVVQEALDHLNVVTERTGAAKFTSPTSIKERIKDGAQLEDLLLVIDFCHAMWWRDTKMETFIRPKTLFGKENFPEYLVRARKWSADGRPFLDSLDRAPSPDFGITRGADYYMRRHEEEGE